jgi:hypothetical protein
MRWAEHGAHKGKGRGVYRVWVGKHEGKKPVGKPRRRWEDNIKDVGCKGMDWIELAQDTDMWWALLIVVMIL